MVRGTGNNERFTENYEELSELLSKNLIGFQSFIGCYYIHFLIKKTRPYQKKEYWQAFAALGDVDLQEDMLQVLFDNINSLLVNCIMQKSRKT